jgi:DNA-binding NarL/FixJ family response regulator
MSVNEAIDYALRRGSGAPTLSERPGGLTPRELEVVQFLAEGFTNRQIADALVIAERTAQRHVENILSKLGVSNRAQVAAWAVERALVGGPAPGAPEPH